MQTDINHTGIYTVTRMPTVCHTESVYKFGVCLQKKQAVNFIDILRLRLHGIGYVQIRLGSNALFKRDRFETGTVQFHMGSPS